jgi:hypothetical protein
MHGRIRWVSPVVASSVKGRKIDSPYDDGGDSGEAAVNGQPTSPNFSMTVVGFV